MTGRRSVWVTLRDLTAIVLVVGLVVGVSTWVVGAREEHAGVRQPMSIEHAAAATSASRLG